MFYNLKINKKQTIKIPINKKINKKNLNKKDPNNKS